MAVSPFHFLFLLEDEAFLEKKEEKARKECEMLIKLLSASSSFSFGPHVLVGRFRDKKKREERRNRGRKKRKRRRRKKRSGKRGVMSE